ncbi:MAG: 2-C-methyl-D-erythritol 4-phosphate cytidylyltransferase [Bacteroidetes bacterium]|nr:2-C-methyl-D-erythritol 4-phosphate cytidylyltransferase [Bacteroidota bacterium]
MRRFALLVAGGQGTRMQGTLPKQFLPLAGEPILAHTLRRFNQDDIEIFLVMHADYLSYWEETCENLENIPRHTLVPGGKTRAQSVAAGLAKLPDEGWVAVHDAVRPLCSSELIFRLYNAAAKEGSAVPVITCRDTLRLLTPDGSKTVPREHYRSVQTPQVFDIEKLKNAFKLPDFEHFTDEASLFEAAGHKVHLEAGEESNIKITFPSDLIVAEAVLKEI